MRRLFLITGICFALGLGTAGAAQATTLGLTSQPAGSLTSNCGSGAIGEATSDPGTPFTVPGPGTLTQWQTVATDDTPGASITLLVLKAVGASFTVAATDTRTIPNPAPAVASYTLSTPITVSGGETFGLWDSASDATCFFNGGSTPAGSHLAALIAPTQPITGQTLNRAGGDSPGGYVLNAAVTFQPQATTPPPTKKKCKKHKKKRSAESAKKKCKKKKKS